MAVGRPRRGRLAPALRGSPLTGRAPPPRPRSRPPSPERPPFRRCRTRARDRPAEEPPPVPADASGALRAPDGGMPGRNGDGTSRRSGWRQPHDGHRQVGEVRAVGAESKRCLRRTGPAWDIGDPGHSRVIGEGGDEQVADCRPVGRADRSEQVRGRERSRTRCSRPSARRSRSTRRCAFAGFGTFATKHHPARTGRNPRTGEAVSIPASVAPAFRAGKAFKDAVNGR